MKKKLTLRKRIVFYFCAYLFVLQFFFIGVINIMIHHSQDAAFRKQISEVTNQCVDSIHESGQLPAMLPPHFQAFLGLSDIPEDLRGYVSSSPGHLEIDEQELNYHVNIIPISDRDDFLYVIYHVAAFELTEEFEFYFNSGLMGLGLVILFIGWLLSSILSNQIITPVSALARQVESFSPDQNITALLQYQADDEVGLLVKTINGLIQRVGSYVQREREFTQFASHELRTPLSVIQGAVEVIELGIAEGNPSKSTPINRIKLSVQELDSLINTFLMLARREDLQRAERTACHVQDIVSDIVETNRYLLNKKDVEVFIDIESDLSMQVPLSIFKIAISNLIRNSFQYTVNGSVRIIADPHSVKVVDTGLGFDVPKVNSGSGLGLLIVERICERMNWKQEISSLGNRGSKVELLFLS